MLIGLGVVCKEDTHPLLLREYMGKRVSMETLVILDELINFQKNWRDDDLIWKEPKKIDE